jgi:ABC-2 type transport system permease protein
MKRFYRSRSRLLANLLQPLFFLLVFGFGFSRFPVGTGTTYLEFLAPGMVAMSVIFSSLFAGVSVLWDRQFGFLQEVLVAPVSRLTIVVGQTLGGSTIALLQGFFIMVAAQVLGVRFIAHQLPLALLFMVLIAFFSAGLGLIIASRLEDPHGFQVIMNLIIIPMVFLSTAFFPLEGLPGWLQGVVYLNPLTYGVDGLRGWLIGVFGLSPLLDLGLLAGFCTTTLLAAAYLFSTSEI